MQTKGWSLFIVVVLSGLIVACVSPSVPQPDLVAPAANNKILPPTEEWISTVSLLAPEKPEVRPKKDRRILIFSLSTGYKHAVSPHATVCVQILGELSGAYQSVETIDPEAFTPEKLNEFDAVVLNNTCPKPEHRDLFLDALGDPVRAGELEKNLIEYVKSGKGLIVLHGGITFQIHSPEVSNMIGGSFDFHPPRQQVTLRLVDPEHPLLKTFDGRSFVHNDEPYFYQNAYAEKNFRPLLEVDTSKLNEKALSDSRVTRDVCYAAWIKRYGNGRVFYCSPSHQPESFETGEMLQFMLSGIQYALGDLVCDDSPLQAQ